MPRSSSQALLLVDGYNIVGAWSTLKQTRDQHGLEAARQELIEILINYSAFRDYKTELVFDAQYRNSPHFRDRQTAHLSVYYTAFAETADTYIEKVCANFQRQCSSRRLIVATSDRAQQLMVIGYGAEWMSALQLEGEVAITARQRRRKHRPQKQSRGRFLANSLDAKARQRLAQWRHGIR
ncbi:MAG: NYN domain-containing protein [Chroococcales cyanobacterium]